MSGHSDIALMKDFEEFVDNQSGINDCDVQSCLNPAMGTYELGDVVLKLCSCHGKHIKS